MESKERAYDQINAEQKSLKRCSYNKRKYCIKKKTMELATLCGIDACTIICGAHGEIDSWPENPTEAKAIIKKFKDLTTNPYKRTTVRDESQKKVIDVAGGEVPSWLENTRGSSIGKTFEEKAEIVDLTKKMVEKSSLDLRVSSLTGYQEFLEQLDFKLEALTKRIEFLKTNQQYQTDCCCIINKQLDYPEKNKQVYYLEESSPKRTKISQAPLFMFDLNYPPTDEPECSALSSDDCNDLRNC